MARKTVGFLVLSFLIGVASTWNIGERELRSGKGLETVSAQEATQSGPDFVYKVLRNDSNPTPCILAGMNITIELPGTTRTNAEPIKVPTGPNVSGTCGEIVSKMSLNWETETKDGGKEKKNITITFTFINDHVTFSIFSIDLNIQDLEKNVTKTITSDLNLRLFPASVKNGMYKTDKYSWSIDNVNLTFENVSLIAFNTQPDGSSRKEEMGADNSGKTFPYDLTADNQKHCILAKMSIALEVQYATVNGTMKKAIVDVPKNATVSGDCDSQIPTPQIVLYWPTGPNNQPIDKQNKITLGLQMGNPQLPLYAVVVDIVLDETNFPDALHAGKRHKEFISDFDTPSEGKDIQIYSCPGARVAALKNITLGISDTLIVFDAGKSIESKKVQHCSSSTNLSAANFNYVLRNRKTNVPCTLANMSVSMEVSYKSKDSIDKKSKTLTVPPDADVNGICGEDLSQFTLAWGSAGVNEQNRLTFYMKRDTDKFLAYKVRTDVYVDETSFPNAADPGTRKVKLTSASLFATSLENGFLNCSDGNWRLQDDAINLTIKEVKLIAFNTAENIVFKKGDVCPDNTPITPVTESPTGNTTVSPNPAMKFDYVVEDKNSSVDCILANMMISVKLSYEKQNSTKGEATLKVPTNANVSGVCDKTEPFMKLSWTEQSKSTFNATDNENYVNLTFHKSDTEFFLHQVNVKLSLDEKNFPGAKNKTYEATSNALTIFPAALKDGIHKCVPGENVTVSDAVLSIKNVTVIAFNTQKNITTRAETNCVAEDGGSNAGAVVGGIIGGLILVGVIALGVIMYRRRRLY